MKLVTAEKIKEIDQICENKYNIPTLLLMEKAGKGIYEHIIKKDWKGKTFAVICGGGNNGGDGLVVARYLYLNGYDVTIYLTENPKSKLASFNYEYAKSLNINIRTNIHPHDWIDELRQYNVIIDAIFGVGYKIKNQLNYPINAIEENNDKYIYSIDIPSGINGNTGKTDNHSVIANETITLCSPKIGLYINPGKDRCGKITCLDIGVPEELMHFENFPNAFTKEDFHTPKRYANSHKGTYGHVGIIGGRANMTGAGSMCALAAYKSGCGYVSIACPERYIQSFSNKVLEAVISPVKGGEYFYTEDSISELKSFIKNKNMIVIGPGLGKDELSEKICIEILEEINSNSNILIDADGIWAINNHLDLLPKNAILTPHPKEMSYLTGLTIQEIQNNRLEIAENFAKKYEVILVLKGNDTITTNGTDTYINTSGCDGMATAGSGDVLSGIIAGLLAQKQNYSIDITETVAGAVWLHGYSGETAQENLGFGMTATDIIKYIKL